MAATFRKAFFDSRKGVLWLVIGLAAYAIMMVSLYPTISETLTGGSRRKR